MDIVLIKIELIHSNRGELSKLSKYDSKIFEFLYSHLQFYEFYNFLKHSLAAAQENISQKSQQS